MAAALARALRRTDREVVCALSGDDACATIEQRSPATLAVAIVDLHMPGVDGFEVLARLKRSSPATQVLILTGHGTIAAAVRAMRLGAADFLEKPFDDDVLCARVQMAQRVWHAAVARDGLADRCHAASGDEFLIGCSSAIRAVRRVVAQMSGSAATVLVEGESGTGKEQFAQAVHFGGRRAGDPFVVVDCSALSPTVVESELFGHAKGAFTGAEHERAGLFRAAAGGTVFLDEIGDLPASTQAKLLRVLQERQVRPIGSETVHPLRARFIAATNRDLRKAAECGDFRNDLYHRLNVVTVLMPPLRARRADIPLLVEHFLQKYGAERPALRGITDEALAVLRAYDWPGNVRELENAVLRAIVLGTSNMIETCDLPPQLILPRTPPGSGETQCRADARVNMGTLANSEDAAIRAALTRTHGNRTRAAAILGIGVATLYRKLKKYGIS